MKNLTSWIAVAGLAAFCLDAGAANAADLPTETVHFAALTGANDPGAPLLFRRIEVAAGRVCGERTSPGRPFISPAWQRCEQMALRNAVAKVNSPAVTAYAAAHGVEAFASTVARRD